MVAVGVGLDLVLFAKGVGRHGSFFEKPTPVAHFARFLVRTEANPCRLEGLNSFHDGFLELLVLELLVSLFARRSFATFGGGMGVGGANQHLFGFPSSLFGRPRLGQIGHVPPDPDGVDQADDGPPLAFLECHGPHVKGIMHVIGFARTQLDGEHSRGHVHAGCTD